MGVWQHPPATVTLRVNFLIIHDKCNGTQEAFHSTIYWLNLVRCAKLGRKLEAKKGVDASCLKKAYYIYSVYSETKSEIDIFTHTNVLLWAS